VDDIDNCRKRLRIALRFGYEAIGPAVQVDREQNPKTLVHDHRFLTRRRLFDVPGAPSGFVLLIGFDALQGVELGLALGTSEMAEIVAAFGVPHTPRFPALVAREGPNCEVARLYAEVAKHVAAAAPDVLVFFDSDHFNTFFFDNLPTFLVGIAEATAGPNDQTPMPHYRVAGHAPLAAHLRSSGIANGFDLSLSQDFDVDHSIMVPLHFLTPDMKIPIVPIFINGLAPPLPGAKRCYALGEMVRAAVKDWPDNMRVAVLASGSFSLEIGGPKIPHGERAGTPDQEWTKRVQHHLQNARVNELLEEATATRMLRAGNIGGELLNWIAMLGTIGERKPRFIEPQLAHGHSYAAWRWD
jgi:aromatic ring-opening dioxygenase catalytic subunit (LigB family)